MTDQPQDPDAGYAALADAQDEEDLAYHAVMRGRVRDGEVELTDTPQWGAVEAEAD